MFSGKKILLGVTGSIAAYKTTFLTRLLIKAGAEVKIILTPAARSFVTPLTLSTLSKNPVLWEYFDPEDEAGEWNNHIDLALWADYFIIAPASSNTLAKMAHATCDNLLMGVYLSAKCPVYFAPAMDLDMYQHPATIENIQKLESFGNICIPAASGELASGLVGEGRMAEPEDILDFITKDIKKGLPLSGKKVLINGGPTYEPIDPVRFIGNHSSGKMGIALAEKAYELGADVELVLGPTHLLPKHGAIKIIRIQTAIEMQNACSERFEKSDITILSAAIADYRPKDVASEKIKKESQKEKGMSISLVENPDILYELGAAKKRKQILVGFALETQNFIENAKKKLHKKNCDIIVLNNPSDKNKTGFGHNTNQVTLIDNQGNITKTKLKDKHEIAQEILQYILRNYLY